MRSKRRALSVAVSGVLISGGIYSPAHATTQTWNSTASQDWFTVANWNSAIPGSTAVPPPANTNVDVALFGSAAAPSNTVNISSPTNMLTLGAIIDQTPSSDKNLTITDTGTLALNGATVTVTEGATQFTQSNVVLADSSASTSSTQTMAVGSATSTLILNDPTSYILVSPSGNGKASNQVLQINSNIVDGASPATLYVDGFGTIGTPDAGAVSLTGTNSFTGGIVVGAPAPGFNATPTQGALVEVTPTSMPTAGNITVNEDSMLLVSGTGNFGNSGQTITLNGIGVGGKNYSGALRTASAAVANILANVNIGTSDAADEGADGGPGFDGQPLVVISPTGSATTIIQVSGALGGTGSIQKQGSGTLELSNQGGNTNDGGMQIGNGVLVVDAGSSAGTGYLQMFQTGSNFTVANFDNLNQNLGNLSSQFTATTPGGGAALTQVINLYGTTGIFNQGSGLVQPTGTGTGTNLNLILTTHSTFGYGVDTSYTSTIQGPGSLTLSFQSTAAGTLSLTGPNLYTGGTTINGGVLNLANPSGSATGTGNVTVNSGGKLTSGNNTLVFQNGTTVATSGTMSGTLIVNNGGIVSPGGDNLVGNLSVGALIAHSGSIFNFDLIGGTTSDVDTITATNALTLDNGGTEDVNVLGSKLAYGTYTLATFGSLANSGTQFTLASNPGGRNRTYTLTTNANSLVLNVVDNGSERYWSAGSTPGSDPAVDGGGIWQNGSTNFFNSNPVMTQAPYDNTSNNDVIIGNGGNGGTITLGGAVRDGGALVLSQVNTPYIINGGGNTLSLGGGIVGSASDTVNAPISLLVSQSVSAAAGTTLILNGAISEASGGTILTVGGDTGTVVFGGANTYSGGTIITSGTLQTPTSSLPAAGGVQINNAAASLAFSQATNGTYAGQITGTGSVMIDNSSPTATVVLSNSSNSYSGGTTIESGVLNVGDVGDLGGVTPGSIMLAGGTFQAANDLVLPGGGGQTLTFAPATTSTIDTNGHNVEFDTQATGSGNLNVIGGGTLTFTSLHSTSNIGNVGVSSGTDFVLAPAGSLSWGFSAAPAGGGIAGNIVIAQPMEFRLWGGTFSGGGNIDVPANNVVFTGEAITTIGANVVLNSNNAVAASDYILDIGTAAGATLTISGSIKGNGNVDFTSDKANILLTGQSQYSGTTTIDPSQGAEVQIDVANALPTTTDMHLTSTGLLDLFGVNQTVGSLSSGNGNGTSIPLIIDEATPSATLSIDGTASTTYAGLITDGSSNSGFVGLTLATGNTGTLTLTNGNSYSGGTTLNGGTLVISSDGNIGLTTGGLTFGGGTLALAPSSGAITTSRPITINPGNSTIDVGSGNSFAISGSPGFTWAGGTLNTTDSATPVSISQTSGTNSVTPGSVLGVSSTASVVVSGSVDPFTDSSVPANHVAILNNGAFSIVDVNSSIAGITGTGALTVGDGSIANTLQLATNSGGSSQNSITINGSSALDITNNHLIISYGANADPISTIRSYLISGYAGGAWNGPGIDSSAANALFVSGNKHYGLGYADGADMNGSSPVVAGLGAGNIEIKYTLYGDANLDGVVNGTDFGILAAHFGDQVTAWDEGDFNYDGVVNGTDFGALAANFGQQASGTAIQLPAADYAALDAFAAANGLMADVPEPASASLLLLAGMGVLSRRRRSIKA
jgi:fibronectin-binding autotransporter adhesin